MYQMKTLAKLVENHKYCCSLFLLRSRIMLEPFSSDFKTILEESSFLGLWSSVFVLYPSQLREIFASRLVPGSPSKPATPGKKLTTSHFYRSHDTMPIDNRRIAGPEQTQPVVRDEKHRHKPLVNTGICIIISRFSGVINSKFFVADQ